MANAWMRIPNEPWLTLEVVGSGADVADDWIVEHIEAHDIVITSDIPLADRCLKQGARALSPTGKPFTDANIGHTVAMRDLLTDLRSEGLATSGPPPLTQRDRSLFLQQLDNLIQALRRQ